MNVATIGTGMIVDWFLNAAKQNNANVVAMYSRKKEHALKLANQYHIKDIYTDLDEMLKREDLEFIYIASPNSLHFTYAMKAMKAGKHVICEKPFTSTLSEFEQLQSYAKQNHLFLFEAIVTKHMPNYLAIKENLASLGKIRMVQCNFSQYSSRYDKLLVGEVTNVFDPAFSGGALADIGIYNLHFVMGLFGKPQRVHYYPNKHTNGIDTSGISVLEYDGFKAVCVGCKDTKSKCITQIQGEKGYLTMDSETSKCSHFTITSNKETRDPSIKENEIALYYEVKDFMELYQKKAYDTCYKMLEDSHEVMEIYQALRKDGAIVFQADSEEEVYECF